MTVTAKPEKTPRGEGSRLYGTDVIVGRMVTLSMPVA
jgi:hypothetical protein